jgi:tRNA (guanosine-2'-O-)-methyltransferase
MEHLSEKRQRLLATSPYSPLAEDRFVFGGREFDAEEIVDTLSDLLTEERRERIEDVLDGRTYNVATVVEGVVNMGNVSAVMRSAEALGFQPFHVVTGGEKFKDSRRTSQGAEKWLDIHQWNSPEQCISYLKGEQYQIIVTHLDESSIPINDVDFTRKTALVFGNERDGVSAQMVQLSDVRCVVPMSGFVRSFNISVAAAVALYHARTDRIARRGSHGDLTEQERCDLRAAFYLSSVRHARKILSDEAGEGREAG